jgi:ELWxxDGT repeat protein
MVANIAAGDDSSMPYEFVAMGNEVFFTVAHSRFYWGLWKSDGTAARTRMVSEPITAWSPNGSMVLQPGLRIQTSGAPYPRRNGLQYLTAIDGKVWCYHFYLPTSNQALVELRSYASDGIATRSPIGHFSFSSSSSRLGTIVEVSGRPYFFFGDSLDYPSPGRWYTADAEGDVVVADEATAPATHTTYVRGLTGPLAAPGNGSTQAVLDDRRFYAFNDGVHGAELWAEDFSPPLSVHSMLPLDASDAGTVDRAPSRGASIFADVVGVTSEETTIEGILKS